MVQIGIPPDFSCTIWFFISGEKLGLKCGIMKNASEMITVVESDLSFDFGFFLSALTTNSGLCPD